MITEQFILNVDDYLPGRYTRTKILTQAGFQVKEAATGGEALRMVKEHPQLIVLDINLPDMDGYEVCRRIKRNPDTAGTIVLHLSASNVLPEHRVTGLENGADSYLTEPVPPEVLVATVRALLRARSAEQALRNSNRQLNSFADMISHELREPLRRVTINAEILNKRLAGKLSEEEQRYLIQTLTGAQRMTERIESILEYSREDHARLDIADVDAERALGDCLEELQQLISESGARIQHDPLPRVRANRTGLTRVFVNLITNAIKYKSERTVEIAITVSAQGDNYLFAVRDNGLGIEARFHERIFEPFKRLHGAELSGAGLGLALCRRVIENAGGEIWVNSELGNGSVFYFTLPAAR